ncbi:MAG: hybrid sensor histidine kinase/response regulator [Acidimicrobiales bacterium]
MSDDELLGIFADEASGRLVSLATGLLRLESGLDPALVDELFREAHTIKGGAAVVGLPGVGAVAHVMEDLLQGLRAGVRPATSELVDTLLEGVDGLRAIIAGLPSRTGGDDDDGLLRARLEDFRDRNPVPTRAPGQSVLSSSPPGGAARDEAGVPTTGLPDTGLPETVSPGPIPPAQPGTGRRAASHSGGDDPTGAIRVPVARLDALVRLVGESAAANLRVERLLVDHVGPGASDLDAVRDLGRSLTGLQEITMRARMVPVGSIVEPLHRATREIARELGRRVRWDARGLDTELDRNVLSQLADPLMHLVRNAVAHGAGSVEGRLSAGKSAETTVGIHAMQLGPEVIVVVRDDGVGIDVARVRAQAALTDRDVEHLSDDEALQLIFRPGLSTAAQITDLSGRGVGLDVVRAAVESLRGHIEVRSALGVGTEFRIRVPITLAVLPCLVVRAGDQDFALPLHCVVVIEGASDREVLWVEGAPVDVSDLADALGRDPVLPSDPETIGRHKAIVVVAGRTHRHGFAVDALLGERTVVVKGLSGLIPRNEVLIGASVEPDGSVLCVIDGAGLVEAERSASNQPPRDETLTRRGPTPRQALLVVDDALTVRELQRSILERHGYLVFTASDGEEAITVLSNHHVDLVLTDVEMPVMDGFALTKAIRQSVRWRNTPVLILTSRATDDDHRRGMEAGADGYLLKSAFDQGRLLAAVERLLGDSP